MILELCCNNPNNGSPLYQSETVQISAAGGEFEITMEGPPIVTRLRADGRLQFGTLILPITGYKEWFGNWCWDAASVDHKQARRALCYMIQRRWQCTEGPSEVYDYLKGNEKIASKFERRYFCAEGWDEMLKLFKKGGAA